MNIVVATAAKEILLYTDHYIFLSCQKKKCMRKHSAFAEVTTRYAVTRKDVPCMKYLPSLVQPLRITIITQVTRLKTFLESLEDDATSEARLIVMMHIKPKTPKTFDEVAS